MIYLDIMNTTYQDIIKKIVLKTMLHHVGMLWIENHEQLKYNMDKKKSEWMTGGPWYNTYICKKLHGKLFEVFIINARTDRYNIMGYIGAHEKEHQPSICDSSSGGGFPLPKHSTIEALESLGATIDFIGCWLKALEHNFIERCNFYTHNMDLLFHKINAGIPNQPIPKETRKFLLRAIGGGWCVEKLGQKLPPLKKSKLSKNPKGGG